MAARFARIDPLARTVMVLLFALTVVHLEQWVTLSVAVLAAVSLLMMAGAARTPLLKRLVAVNGFVLMLLLLLPFTMPGSAMFSVYGVSASSEGLQRALQIALRANAVVTFTLVLLSSVEPAALAQVLERLRVPRPLTVLLLFTVRYIFVIRDEYLRMRRAMRARGFVARNSRHTYISLGYVLGMSLVRALDRSERVLAAMRCRGFQGQMPSLGQQQMSKVDVAALVVVVVFCVALTLSDT